MSRTLRPAPARLLQEDSLDSQESTDTIPSPSASHSDKENMATPRSQAARAAKGSEAQAMPPPSSTARLNRSNKRRRLTDQGSQTQTPGSQSQRRRESRYFDPDQDQEERREVRRGLRDLSRDLNDSRSEYMQEGNDGILKTVEKANEYFHKVKQTSDATIDSRLLVSAADLSFKKTAHLALGDSAAGIDVDEFVSKCIAFMRQGSTDSSTSLRPAGTQRRRHGRPSGGTQRDPDDSEDDQGDAMNWDWLGRAACFPHNGRPCVSGFLLGPLSVQKRTRQQTQRRARERIDPTQAVKPQELREEDLDKLETSNLTQMCAEINKLLSQTQLQGQQAVEAEMSQMAEDVPAEVVQDVMEQHCVADDGGVPLFHFCLDPESFGQSVENMFYVSFLVRDGLAGIATDSRGLPTIHAAKPYAPSEAQKKGIQKHQAVFSLDFETWEKLIEVYGIKKSVIPHRAEAAPPETTRQGWYG